MKRKNFNVYDAFAVFVAYLISEGKANAWSILIPYGVEILVWLISFVFTFYRVGDRLQFWIWKKGLSKKVNKAAAAAKAQNAAIK